MPAPDLSVMFRMAPEEAIRYLESKGMRVTFNWQEMLDSAHARAFTVAKAMSFDILGDIRGALVAAMKAGQDQRAFIQSLEPVLRAKGWWGKKVSVDPDTLEAQLVQLGSHQRLATIYRTNLQSAYMAGRFKGQMAAPSFPYWQYVAVIDAVTRPSHALLNNKVWPRDDPVWATIYPPNGFSCRCRVRPLTASQVERGKYPVMRGEGAIVTREVDAGLDRLTGEVTRTTVTGVKIGEETMWVDAGFNSSPVASHLFDDLLYQKAVRALDQPAAQAAIQDILLSEPRMRAWRAFVEATLATGRQQGQTIGIGLAGADELARARAAGVVPTPILAVEDRQLVEVATRGGLSREEWLSLPAWLPAAEVYFDSRSGTTTYLIRRDNGRAVIWQTRLDGAFGSVRVVSAGEIAEVVRQSKVR